MDHRPLHLHSMMVHAVVALAPLAALCFVLEAGGMAIFSVRPGVWAFLLRGSLIGMLVLAVPSILTGVVERNHMYVNWPPSHRAKLALSLLLVVMVSIELTTLGSIDGAPGVASWLGLAIVIGNCAVVFGLSFFGLQITLGRQGLGATSYKPDMDWDPPLDILACVADFAGDPPKLIDVQGEAKR
ncbi:MAG: hypothetical protein IFK91_01600 [Acidobacteria bacterium]|nr:hypothetical protein [Candidatus Sulfomarinibacter sp. MAG AM1]